MKLFIGLISGTSMDGIDAALVDFSANEPNLIASVEIPVPENFKKDMRRVITEKSIRFDELAYFEKEMARLSSHAVDIVLQEARVKPDAVTAIGSHGQTLFHIPGEYSLQIGDPNRIARQTGIKTIADFRRMDIASGGQGAPLAPLFHREIFKDPSLDSIVLNMGGIANITHIPSQDTSDVVGFDTGPANTLMDKWCHLHTQATFDKAGAFARTGTVVDTLLEKLLEDDYFQAPHPKSTGPEYFNLDWVKEHMPGSESPEDIQATLLELTAVSIARAIKSLCNSGRIILCGGGAENTYLVERLTSHLETFSLIRSDELGVPGDSLEAMTFAWLAKKYLDGDVLDAGSITGANESGLLGGCYKA